MNATARPSTTEPFSDRLARLSARLLQRRLVKARNSRPLVSFTFDDIPATAATAGAAILDGNGVRGTFYVAGSMIGAEVAGRPMATAREIAALRARGHEIGCHTFQHRPLKSLSERDLVDDLNTNSAHLRSVVDSEIRLENFALPFNAPTFSGKRVLSRRFRSSRGGIPGVNADRVDLAFLRAVELGEPAVHGAKMERWLDTAQAVNGWLIFFTHDVAEDAGPWGCSPDLLQRAVQTALARGLQVCTVSEALDAIGAPLV